jgi:hypothetical protein
MTFQLVQMIEEIKKCEAAGATTACLMQIYVYIDTFAYFGMPITETKNTRRHFTDWVNKYLKAEPTQTYQYRGNDVYGARCALLHTFASDADYHQSNPETLRFAYTDGGRHIYDPAVEPSLAIIGVASLINDFIIAVEMFFKDIHTRIADSKEQTVLQERLNKILGTIPVLSPATV